ncbi:MAG: hypothetical protein WA913_15300 [Pricia sp.]
MKDNLERQNKDAIQHYLNLGFHFGFKIEDGTLMDPEIQNSYTPDEVYIFGEYSAGNLDNSQELSVTILFKTIADRKGVYVINSGNARDRQAWEFFKKVPKENHIEMEAQNPRRS